MEYYEINESDENDIRQKFFYGLNNLAVVFRNRNPNVFMKESIDGMIVGIFDSQCSSARDFLSYLLAVYKTGHISICQGDVIVMKINGFFMSYRFTGFNWRNNTDVFDFFVEQNSFETKERNEYISQLHKKNCVLDVFSGKEVPVGSISLQNTAVCAIDKENFYPQGKKENLIVTDYFVYELRNMKIEVINPRQQPFCDIRSAFNFFMYNRNFCRNCRKKNKLLLFDRKELYFMRDYIFLKEIAL